MTEKEKMLEGLPYLGGDPELMGDKSRARLLAERYNASGEDAEEREALLRELLGACGENVQVKPPFHCDYGYRIKIGKNFLANFDCVILDSGSVEIGDNCMFGPQTCIYSLNHPLDREARRTGLQLPKPVRIGNDVWLGGNCVVLPGVNIGNNVVVGAGSVVTHDLPNDCLAVGNPARVIKKL